MGRFARVPDGAAEIQDRLCRAAAGAINDLTDQLLAMGHTPDTAAIAERTYYDDTRGGIVFECWPVFKKTEMVKENG